jgi:DNA gyrase subunit A
MEEEEAEEVSGDATLSQERYAEMSAVEEFILTLSEQGYGKRSSSFEYRVTRRGGKGIVAMRVNERNGALVASFPVEDDDQIMLVTNAGQLIRVPVDGIRIVGRSTSGVTVFDTAEGENVVSVERITETGEEDDEENGESDEPDAADDNGTDDGAPDA